MTTSAEWANAVEKLFTPTKRESLKINPENNKIFFVTYREPSDIKIQDDGHGLSNFFNEHQDIFGHIKLEDITLSGNSKYPHYQGEKWEIYYRHHDSKTNLKVFYYVPNAFIHGEFSLTDKAIEASMHLIGDGYFLKSMFLRYVPLDSESIKEPEFPGLGKYLVGPKYKSINQEKVLVYTPKGYEYALMHTLEDEKSNEGTLFLGKSGAIYFHIPPKRR